MSYLTDVMHEDYMKVHRIALSIRQLHREICKLRLMSAHLDAQIAEASFHMNLTEIIPIKHDIDMLMNKLWRGMMALEEQKHFLFHQLKKKWRDDH